MAFLVGFPPGNSLSMYFFLRQINNRAPCMYDSISCPYLPVLTLVLHYIDKQVSLEVIVVTKDSRLLCS